jgi:acetoin utilization deacetylase AcuC-like enzyme
LKVLYSARYRIDIGLHVFPTEKYGRVHDRLAENRSIAAHLEFVEPQPATWDELALVHTPGYLAGLRDGTLSDEEVAQLELPWSAEMVEGFRLMTGGTIQAARMACGLDSPFRRLTSDSPIVCHLGGGLHHAFPSHGEGFCPLNDVAVAVRVLQSLGIDRHAIVDLDVHHGNGTAFVFNHAGPPPPALTRSDRGPRAYPERDVADGVADSRVFTFSMHQQHNYPMWKPKSTLDVGLPDGTHDTAYLGALEGALPHVMAHEPQCVFYLAGADPYEDDQLGGLRLTKEGLRLRDRLVIETVNRAGVPLVVTLAGGYARRVEDTVAIHCATIEAAFRGPRG